MNQSSFNEDINIQLECCIKSSVIQDQGGKPQWVWPNGEVPYIKNFNQIQYKELDELITKSIMKFQQQTPLIKFTLIDQNNKPNCYISFEVTQDNEIFAQSEIGRQLQINNKIIVNPNNDIQIGNIMHEIMHALGFDHEHQRLDRNDHLKFSNSQSFQTDINYRIESNSFCLGRYDFDSIMHYPQDQIMSCKNEKYNQRIGQRVELSPDDLLGIEYVYGEPKCTFDLLGEVYFAQNYYECETCWGENSNYGICEYCKINCCHKDHQMVKRTAKELIESRMTFVCDCGRLKHQQQCSRRSTFSQPIEQAMYYCFTCNHNQQIIKQQMQGICKKCSEICHQSHEVELIKTEKFFCHCGLKRMNNCFFYDENEPIQSIQHRSLRKTCYIY